MQIKYASIIATVNGVDREVVERRQPVNGWAEVDGQDIHLHLDGPTLGPVTATGENPRLAIYPAETGGEWVATLPLTVRVVEGSWVPLR